MNTFVTRYLMLQDEPFPSVPVQSKKPVWHYAHALKAERQKDPSSRTDSNLLKNFITMKFFT